MHLWWGLWFAGCVCTHSEAVGANAFRCQAARSGHAVSRSIFRAADGAPGWRPPRAGMELVERWTWRPGCGGKSRWSGLGSKRRFIASRRAQGPAWPGLGARWALDTFVHEPSEPDRAVVLVAPTIWWNDATDATLGLRLRGNYQGRFNRWTIWLHRGFGGFESATLGESVDFYVQLANPTWLRNLGAGQSVEGWAREGTVGARVALTVGRSLSPGSSGHRADYMAQWIATRQTTVLDRTLWDNAGTVELGRADRWVLRSGNTTGRVALDVRGGVSYVRGTPQLGERTYEGELFTRATASASVRHDVAGFSLGARVFAGGYGFDTPVRQRAIPINGADPYQTLANPLVRTQGAPLVDPDVFYHSPGNASLRGYALGLGGRWAVSANLELERDIIKTGGLFRRASVVTFWDAGVVDTLAVASRTGSAYKTLHDGGAGIRVWLHVGDVLFPVRVEFPVYVSSPFSAQNRRQGNDAWEFRWLVSFQPIF